MRYSELTETFDSPYEIEWYRKSDHFWGAYAYAPPPDHSTVDVQIRRFQTDNGKSRWSVEFYKNDEYDITGEGDAFRTFSSVLAILQEFINTVQPDEIKFTSDKSKSASRSKLYNKLVSRFADKMGYVLDKQAYSSVDFYSLKRKST